MHDPTPMFEDLVDQLAPLYHFAQRPALTFIRAGQASSTIYRVNIGDQAQILRLYGPQGAGEEGWIQFELELLLFLQQHGLPVAAPLPRIDGALFGLINAAEGLRPAALFSFAEGTVEWPLAPARSHQLGQALARLHLAADGFPAPPAARTYDLERLVTAPLARILPFITSPADRAFLEDLATAIKVYLRAIPQEPPYFGVIHGDIHQGNCHFASDSLTLFDFSLSGVGWRAYDLTGFLWPLRDATINDPPVRAACDAFLAGYEALRPLHPAEKAAIPAFVKTRDLWEHGDWLANEQDLDAAQVRDAIAALIRRFRALPLK